MAPVTIRMVFPVALLFINSCMIALAVLAIALRFWSRRLKKVQIRANDYIVLIAWLFAFGLIVCMNLSVTKGGVGQHQNELSLSELEYSLKMFVAIGVFGSLSVATVKVSALGLFITIFPNKRFHQVAYFVVGITLSYGFSFAVTSLAACRPFAFNWDKTIKDGSCIDTSTFYVAQTVIGVILDVVVVALPMPMLWGLRMRVQKKIVLTGLFGMGILICIISAFRAVINSKSKFQQDDFPSYAGVAVLLGGLEATLSIINACLPVMQPMLNLLSAKLKTSLRGTRDTPTAERPTKSSIIGIRNLRFGGGEEANFNRLHDHLYPVSENDTTLLSLNTRTETHIARYGGREDVEMNHLEHLQREPLEPHSSIAVTKAWSVSSKAPE